MREDAACITLLRMHSYGGRTEFRQGKGFLIMYLLLTALFAGGAYFLWRAEGWSWGAITLAVMVVVGLGAIVETRVLRIRLTNDALIVRDLRGTRAYARRDIVAIAEEKGAPPYLRLRDGRWVKLPSVTHSLGNSVRAWLKSS